MTKITHTPAPWTLRPPEKPTDLPAVVDADGRVVVRTYTAERQQANARLIAAAPDLLQACEDALPVLRDIAEDGDAPAFLQALAEQMADAIREATGGDA